MYDDGPPPPKVMTPAQAAVYEVCDAFGWPEALKAGHAAAWAKRTRLKLGLELEQFIVEFAHHYGRRDPGAGEWWIYREQFPCKGQGAFPTPAMVVNTWGRWELPVAVNLRSSEPAGFDSLRAFLGAGHDAH